MSIFLATRLVTNKGKSRTKAKPVVPDPQDVNANVDVASSEPKPKRARKKKPPPEPPKPSDFPLRVNSSWKVGAHVSAAGGVENAITNAAAIGCVVLHFPRRTTHAAKSTHEARMPLHSFSSRSASGQHLPLPRTPSRHSNRVSPSLDMTLPTSSPTGAILSTLAIRIRK
jgi:hypothetical protein